MDDDQTMPEMLLEDLRWKADQAIITPFGESVWLKQVTGEEAGLSHGYLTECCFTDDPCERHAEISTDPLDDAVDEAG